MKGEGRREGRERGREGEGKGYISCRNVESRKEHGKRENVIEREEGVSVNDCNCREHYNELLDKIIS